MLPLPEQTGWNFILNPMPQNSARMRLKLSIHLSKPLKLPRNIGLEVNAGHDLNLDNLRYFHQNIPWMEEVSIGHALISDALYLGLENTIQMYKASAYLIFSG